MLLLQGGLNQLKLRALVAEATSSRHQISASAVEASVVQAEALGFAIDQMAGLEDLLARERAEDPSIDLIAIVSPIGTPILSSGNLSVSSDEADRVLKRVLGSQEKNTRFDSGERLYTGRLLFDSSGAVMGAVLIVAPTEIYLAQAQQSFMQMRLTYATIFLVSAVLLIPLVVFQFAGLRHAFGILDPRIFDGQAIDHTEATSPELAELKDLIVTGSEKVAQIETELVQLVGTKPGSEGVST
ncbi:MAG: hypothetical protein AAGI36_06710 [Pseudomonadota bacterium]